jgi:ClpP class serine protease
MKVEHSPVMINQLLIEEVFMSPLCIESQYAQALAMSGLALFSQGKQAANLKYVKSFTVDASTGQKNTGASKGGSVGIVVLNGPVVSHSDAWYGIKGTIELAQELFDLDNDPNVIGTVFINESGGGAVYALKPIIDVMNGLKKPVVTFSRQILGSAAYRIAANTNYIMMYHPLGIVGSIGTMGSFSDMQPMFEKWGMKFFEYYATESVLKNKTYSLAKQGNGKALIANVLDPMNTIFLADIKALRGDKLDMKEQSIFQGETYMADPRGLALGLIDGMGDLPDAIAMVITLANGGEPSKNSSNSNTSNKMFNIFNKFPKMVALAAVATESITPAQMQAVNEEIVANGINGVTLCLDSDLKKLEQQITEAGDPNSALATANARIKELETANSTLTTEKTNAETAKNAAENDRDQWKGKAEQYGAAPGAETTDVAKPEGAAAEAQPGEADQAIPIWDDPNSIFNQMVDRGRTRKNN